MSSEESTQNVNPNSTIQDTINAIQQQKKVYKIIVLGDPFVGKTTLTYRFCDGKFLDSVETTIGVDFRSKVVNIDGEDITLQLWDTAGQERHRYSMIRHYYRNVNAIVFVYDVTNSRSFDSLIKLIEECDKNCLLDVPRILVGNKCDGIAAVTTNVAQRFADQYGMPLFETSARLDSQCDNVEAIFLTLAHKLKYSKPFMRRTNNTVTINVQNSVEERQANDSWSCSVL